MKSHANTFIKFCLISFIFLSSISLDVLAGPKSVPAQLEMIKELLDKMDSRQKSMQTTQKEMDARQLAMESVQKEMNLRQKILLSHQETMLFRFDSVAKRLKTNYAGLSYIYSYQQSDIGIASGEVCIQTELVIGNSFGLDAELGLGWPNVLHIEAKLANRLGLDLGAGLGGTVCFSVPLATIALTDVTLGDRIEEDGYDPYDGGLYGNMRKSSSVSVSMNTKSPQYSNQPTPLIQSSSSGTTSSGIDLAVLKTLADSITEESSGVIGDLSRLYTQALPSPRQVITGIDLIADDPAELFKVNVYKGMSPPLIQMAMLEIPNLVEEIVDDPCTVAGGMPIISDMDEKLYDWICDVDPKAIIRIISISDTLNRIIKLIKKIPGV